MYNVSVSGLGYVGLVSAIGLAALGHKVLGIDTNPERIKKLKSGELPIHEPGLQETLYKAQTNGNISFTDCYSDSLGEMDFSLVCVPTPSLQSGEADISIVESAIRELSERLKAGSTIVIRSTIPIGTSSDLAKLVSEKGIHIAFNPEFFSEGQAVKGFFEPDRIVVGSNKFSTSEKVAGLYSDLEAETIVCDFESAETIKHASNAYLALRLSFVNELAMLCKASGADFQWVSKGIGLDARIGSKFLLPGPGWGGSCFPKDTAEIVSTAVRLGTPMKTIEVARESNRNHIETVAELILSSSEVANRVVAIWGLAFKAGTDDTRESPVLAIARILIERGATVHIFDPIANKPPDLHATQHSSAEEACRGADTLAVLTDWPEFSEKDPATISNLMAVEASVLDFRSVLDPTRWHNHFNFFWTLDKR